MRVGKWQHHAAHMVLMMGVMLFCCNERNMMYEHSACLMHACVTMATSCCSHGVLSGRDNVLLQRKQHDV